jgi:hypothetical protein
MSGRRLVVINSNVRAFFSLQRVVVQPSLQHPGRQGVFAQYPILPRDFITEFGGRVVETDIIKRQFPYNYHKIPQIKQIEEECLDGRQNGPFNLKNYYFPNHLLGSYVCQNSQLANSEYVVYQTPAHRHHYGGTSEQRLFVRATASIPAGGEIIVNPDYIIHGPSLNANMFSDDY